MTILKNKKGITLIALVITIIVILILAGVSIMSITGENGVLNKAVHAKEKMSEAENRERVELAILGSYGEDGKLDLETLKENLKAITGATVEDTDAFPVTVTIGDKAYIIDEEGNITETGDVTPIPTVGTVVITQENGSAISEEGVEWGTPLKITYPLSIADGTIESVTPGTYSNGIVTYITDGTDGDITFTITYKVDGKTKIETRKVEGLGNKYKNKLISLSDLKADAENNYGGVVTNYTANNLEWKLFYVDEETNRVYLITSDYVPIGKLPVSKAGLTTMGTHQANWSSVPSMQTIQSTPDDIKTLFKATRYTLNSSNINSKCVSTMLNHNNWTDFVDTKWADYAIGGSTIEMWIESWNDMYPSDKLYCDANDSETGYYVGTSNPPISDNIAQNIMEIKTGYTNTLFYPHTSTYNNCNCYWIASPSARGEDYIMLVDYRGVIGRTLNTSAVMSFRPIVSIKSMVKVINNYDGTYTLKQN